MEKKENPVCPHNHEFGIDNDQYAHCDDCDIWDACVDRKDAEVDAKQIKAPPRQEYIKLLKHPKWQQKRLKIFERDDWTCQICKDKETTLHCHHKEYTYGNKPWDYPDEKLITLCQNCHAVIEKTKKEGIKFDEDSTSIFYSQNIICAVDKSPRLLFYTKDGSNGIYFESTDIDNVLEIITSTLQK